MNNLIDKNQSVGKNPVVKLLLEPAERDLGDFTVRRFLPHKEMAHIGPFIFFDHLGPVSFPPGKGLDVRPHPHIGLATVTYVLTGEIIHRDNLDNVQPIRPNAINWMTAGRGIVHSERTSPQLRKQEHSLEALQFWLALPEEEEQTEPFFTHYDESALPMVEIEKAIIRILIGEAFGVKAAVKTHSPTLFVEIQLEKGGKVTVPENVEERAIYIISGEIAVQDRKLAQHELAVFDQTAGVELKAIKQSKLVVIGGSPLGKRTLWWNLVSSRKDLIERAKQEWREKKFPKIAGETEFIPLPE